MPRTAAKRTRRSSAPATKPSFPGRPAAEPISHLGFEPWEPGRGKKRSLISFVRHVRKASPMEIVSMERDGIPGRVLKEMALVMQVPARRLYHILGAPKATVERKIAANQVVSGTTGQAALGMVRLLGLAQDIVDKSTAPEAKKFDTAKWLGEWIETPQPALGNKKPADLLDTPTGVEIVARTLGALQSGAYM
jgi:putative toxin-antitoxin system antitoxin component (TIGR02293 family)